MVLSHAYVHSTLLTNIGIFTGSSSYTNCGFNSQKLTLIKTSNWYGFWRLLRKTHKGFVPGTYRSAYSAFNFICIESDSYCYLKQFSKLVLFSQTIVFQFLKEV